MKRKGVIASFGSVKSREEQAGWIIEQGGVVMVVITVIVNPFHLVPVTRISYLLCLLLPSGVNDTEVRNYLPRNFLKEHCNEGERAWDWELLSTWNWQVT